MTVLPGGLIVRSAFDSRRVCLVAGAFLGTCNNVRRQR
jgi:hypothetical protein